MKKPILITTLTLLMISMMVLNGCKKEAPLKNEPAHLDLSPQGKMMVAASNEFAFNVFKKTEATAGVDENMMLSPLSISMALGMTLNGAANATLDSIKNALGFDQLTQQQINSNYRLLIPFLVQADPAATLGIANSIWYRDDFQPLQSFLDTCAHYYSAMISQLDFSNPASLSAINNWVANETNQKITNLLSVLKPDDVMYLINAVYFKGNWTMKFKTSDTQQDPFFKSSGSQVNVSIMHAKNHFKYAYLPEFSMLELDYGNTNFAMDILLPHHNKTIDDILPLLDAGTFDSWIQQLFVTDDMQIAIPKFRFQFEKRLDEVLSSLGMGIAFSEYADFTGISTTLPLMITEVKHKTFIDVNEEGTEAAAATSVGVGYTSVPPSFVANRPFIFLIRETDTNTILFIGRVSDPVY